MRTQVLTRSIKYELSTLVIPAHCELASAHELDRTQLSGFEELRISTFDDGKAKVSAPSDVPLELRGEPSPHCRGIGEIRFRRPEQRAGHLVAASPKAARSLERGHLGAHLLQLACALTAPPIQQRTSPRLPPFRL